MKNGGYRERQSMPTHANFHRQWPPRPPDATPGSLLDLVLLTGLQRSEQSSQP